MPFASWPRPSQGPSAPTCSQLLCTLVPSATSALRPGGSVVSVLRCHPPSRPPVPCVPCLPSQHWAWAVSAASRVCQPLPTSPCPAAAASRRGMLCQAVPDTTEGSLPAPGPSAGCPAALSCCHPSALAVALQAVSVPLPVSFPFPTGWGLFLPGAGVALRGRLVSSLPRFQRLVVPAIGLQGLLLQS